VPITESLDGLIIMQLRVEMEMQNGEWLVFPNCLWHGRESPVAQVDFPTHPYGSVFGHLLLGKQVRSGGWTHYGELGVDSVVLK
jgi:hypothetical protein